MTAAPDVPATQPPAPAPSRRQLLRDCINRLATRMQQEQIALGDQAQLRRQRQGPAFWKIVVHDLEPAGLLIEGPGARDAHRRWTAILAGLARAPDKHRPGRRLGAALAEADAAEMRLLRLVRSHDERLLDDVRAITHQLVGGGHPFDWADIAELVLSDDTPFGAWGEDVRRHICLDYYRDRARTARGGEKEGR